MHVKHRIGGIFIKKKWIVMTVVSIALLATGCFYSIRVLAASKNKAEITVLVSSYLNFKQNNHKLQTSEQTHKILAPSDVSNLVVSKDKDLDKFVDKKSALYKKMSTLIQNAILDQQDGKRRSFGGSAKNIVIQKINVTNSTASVDLAYDAHATFGQWQIDHWVKVSPENTIIDHIFLTKDFYGKWSISDENWTFARGSEP